MSKKEIIRIFLFFLLIDLVFFHGIFKGLVPAPFDALTGGYYPWHDYKWGYPTGVPIKNPILSDVFSVSYPVRTVVTKALKQGYLPLWNPYSFSGAPLLATWQSGALYPFSLFMLILGDLPGWTTSIILQPLLSLLFTYFFLREINLSKKASVFGSITFAFSGFMMIFLENNSSAQTGIWLPLMLLLIEKYLKGGKTIWLFGLPFATFFLFTAGSFQIISYSLAISAAYSLTRANNLKKSFFAFTVKIFFFILLGIGLSCVQLIPTLELFNNSIRQYDENIKQYNYGLIPVKNLLTFIAPDFFGNPTTYNGWSGLYHEQSGYFGIISLPLIIIVLVKKRNFFIAFFGTVFIVSLVAVFDTFLGKAIYSLKIPLFSTSYASRALYVIDFSAAILAAFGLDSLKLYKKSILKTGLIILLTIICIVFAIIILIQLSNNGINLKVSLRNLILPTILISVFLVLLRVINNIKYLTIAIILLATFDLFRFGLKFNPFVPKTLAYPTTPVLDFLTKNVGFNRIDREQSEVLPPNTWQMYRLMSPSGYEPLYPLNYANFHNVLNGNLANNSVSRYAETRNYQSPLLDLVGVKYFLAAKRDKDNKIDAEKGMVSDKFSDPKFKKVFEDKSVVVLENKNVFPRVSLFDRYLIINDYKEALNSLKSGFDFRNNIILNKEPSLTDLKKDEKDEAKITGYYPNEVIISSKTTNNTLLMLTDSYYPGWEVYVDDRLYEIFIADGIFRAVAVPRGIHNIKFVYNPKSFKIGLSASLGTLFVLGALAFIIRKK